MTSWETLYDRRSTGLANIIANEEREGSFVVTGALSPRVRGWALRAFSHNLKSHRIAEGCPKQHA